MSLGLTKKNYIIYFYEFSWNMSVDSWKNTHKCFTELTPGLTLKLSPAHMCTFHSHQNKHVLGHFQYYDLLNKRIKCTKILFLPQCEDESQRVKINFLNSWAWCYFILQRGNSQNFLRRFLKIFITLGHKISLLDLKKV